MDAGAIRFLIAAPLAALVALVVLKWRPRMGRTIIVAATILALLTLIVFIFGGTLQAREAARAVEHSSWLALNAACGLALGPLLADWLMKLPQTFAGRLGWLLASAGVIVLLDGVLGVLALGFACGVYGDCL